MTKRPLADLIKEQNRLAQAKAPSRPFTVVRVLVAGRYNGPDLKSQRAKVDDIISIAAGQYTADIIADGLVEIPAEEPKEVPAEEPAITLSGVEVPSDFAKMNVADLRSLANAAGIDPTGLKKAELIAAIEELRRAS